MRNKAKTVARAMERRRRLWFSAAALLGLLACLPTAIAREKSADPARRSAAARGARPSPGGDEKQAPGRGESAREDLRAEIDALVDALSSRDQQQRDRAQARLIEIGGRREDGPTGEQHCRMVVQALGRISHRRIDAWVRRRAIVKAIDGQEFDVDMRRGMVIEIFDRLETTPLVIWSSNPNDLDQRREPRSTNDRQFLEPLRKFGAQGLDLLEEAAKTGDTRFRINAAYLMAQLDPPRAARLFFTGEDPDVRAVAVFAYSWEASGFPDLVAAFEPVAKLAKDPAPSVRWAVARSARFFHRRSPNLPKLILPPKVIPLLLGFLHDPARVVRSAAASLLEELTHADVAYNPYHDKARRTAQAQAWETWWNKHRGDKSLELFKPLESDPSRGWSASDAFRLRLGKRKR